MILTGRNLTSRREIKLNVSSSSTNAVQPPEYLTWKCQGVCPLLVFYAAYYIGSILTFRHNLSVSSSRVKQPKNCLSLEDGTERLSRNVGTELQFYAIENHKRTSLPLTSRRKPEITQAPCRAIDVTFHSNSQVIAQQLGLGKSVRICSHKYVRFFCLNDKLFKAFLSSIKRSMYMPRQALDFFP